MTNDRNNPTSPRRRPPRRPTIVAIGQVRWLENGAAELDGWEFAPGGETGRLTIGRPAEVMVAGYTIAELTILADIEEQWNPAPYDNAQ